MLGSEVIEAVVRVTTGILLIHHSIPTLARPPAQSHNPFTSETPSRWTMETPEISESTPLLHLPPLPCIRLVIDRLLAQSNTTPAAEHILAQFPHRNFTPSYRTAFVLITLLQIESDARKQLARDDSLDLWEMWDHHVSTEFVVEHCASHVLEVWSDFLQVQKRNADLDILLWTKFPLDVGGYTGVCRTFLRPGSDL